MNPKIDTPSFLTGLWGTPLPVFHIQSTPLLEQSDIPPEAVQWLKGLAPKLDALKGVDFASLANFVSALQATITSLQTSVTLESIERRRAEKKADFEAAEKKAKDAAEKAKEAADAAEKAKVGDWLAAIAGVLGAVMAVAGAFALGANPFLIGAAVVACVLAVQNLTNVALSAAKTETTDALGNKVQLSISWAAAVQAIQTKLIDDGAILRRDENGNVRNADGKIMTAEELKAALAKNPFTHIMTEEQLAKERVAVSMTIEIAVALATIACGVKGMLSVGKAAADTAVAATQSTRLGIKASQETWTALGRWSEAVTAVTDVTSAAGEIASAAYQGIRATVQAESSDARAEQLYYERMLTITKMVMRDLETLLKKIVQALDETYSGMTDQVKKNGELGQTIARHIVQVN